jgi:hypothetical protein
MAAASVNFIDGLFFRRGVALLPHLEPVIRKKILSLVFGGFGCLSLVVGFVEEARL